jgi:hypothetical protein
MCIFPQSLHLDRTRGSIRTKRGIGEEHYLPSNTPAVTIPEGFTVFRANIMHNSKRSMQSNIREVKIALVYKIIFIKQIYLGTLCMNKKYCHKTIA